MQDSPPVSDEELARQTQLGLLDAFEQLVFRYEHRVHGFVKTFCRNETDAREITQDTFVKAFQGIRGFNSSGVFTAWLFTIARRKCIDKHRARQRTSDEPVPDLPDNTDTPESLACREDGENLWHIARKRLNKNQFHALWLHYAEDLGVAEIAIVLGKTRVHVKVLLFRARQILARELRPQSATATANPARITTAVVKLETSIAKNIASLQNAARREKVL